MPNKNYKKNKIYQSLTTRSDFTAKAGDGGKRVYNDESISMRDLDSQLDSRIKAMKSVQSRRAKRKASMTETVSGRDIKKAAPLLLRKY